MYITSQYYQENRIYIAFDTAIKVEYINDEKYTYMLFT